MFLGRWRRSHSSDDFRSGSELMSSRVVDLEKVESEMLLLMALFEDVQGKLTFRYWSRITA
jgi:hypothetical protein